MSEILHCNQKKSRRIYRSLGFKKVFNTGGIPLLVKNFINKKSYIRKIILFLSEYYQKWTFNRTINTRTSLRPKLMTWGRHIKRGYSVSDLVNDFQCKTTKCKKKILLKCMVFSLHLW